MQLRAVPAFCLLVCVMTACGEEPAREPAAPRDPQVAAALNDPLMIDPDLSSRNEGAAAITVDGPMARPVLPATAETIADLQGEAAAVAGGALDTAPAPSGTAAALAPGPAAQAIALAGQACADTLSAGPLWAARMPVAAPIYPRGATQAAAGGDAPGCRVRAVEFTTPVPPAAVADFYWTLARRAGAAARIAASAGGQRISARGAGLALDVRIAADGQGGAIVRLATRTD